MSNLAWAQWWSAPWISAHEDWKSLEKQAALVALHLTRQVVTGTHYGVAPRLPPMPDPALLQIALASTDQLDLGLALIDGICRPAHANRLDDNHLKWCHRLSKALPLDMVQPDNDPLQLLRAWVIPATWQRIRLRFPRRRVLALEENTIALGDAHSRLDTLWHAVAWRMGAMNDTNSGFAPGTMEINDVMPAQN